MVRIFHPWHKWECYKAGFYETRPPNDMTPDEAREFYSVFLRDTPAFEAALMRVTGEWINSCEHFLTNDQMNRIAWLGQASMCIANGVPSCFRGGFKLLSNAEQRQANGVADKWLGIWERERSSEGENTEIYRSVAQSGLFG